TRTSPTIHPPCALAQIQRSNQNAQALGLVPDDNQVQRTAIPSADQSWGRNVTVSCVANTAATPTAVICQARSASRCARETTTVVGRTGRAARSVGRTVQRGYRATALDAALSHA